MAQLTNSEKLAIAMRQKWNTILTFPYLILIGGVVIGLLHILAALISQRDVLDFGPLRIPAMIALYIGMMIIVWTLLQRGDLDSFRLILSNKTVLFALVALLVFLLWLSSNATTSSILPRVFAIYQGGAP